MNQRHHAKSEFFSNRPGGIARDILLLLALPLLFAAGTAFLHPNAPAWSEEALGEGEVNLAMIEAWDGEVLWVDARPREAFEAGRVPGALLLNEDEWHDRLLDFFDRWIELSEPRVVVYCSSRGCRASHQVAERLREETGADNIFVLQGGWETWREAAP